MNDKPKFYDLMMFPYPSGSAMHVWHASNYLYSEIVARYKRMRWYDVIFPLGYDSFGLPTENFAIKNNKSARQATEDNITYFDEQVKAMDFSLDKDRMLKTSDPEYYKWTQWIFSKLYKHDLVYRKDGLVNRCPSCQTVLANDQIIDGKCERCESVVIQKQMPQRYIKITDYAEQLLDYSDCDWPEETITHQKNWIGKSEWAEIDFEIEWDRTITVFTTRPDTLFGVTAIVLAPENKIIDSLLDTQKVEELKNFRAEVVKMNSIDRQSIDRSKNGIFSGLYAKQPFTWEKVPLWYGDYVLPDYATGAVMLVPAHDERDWEFANKYDMEVKQVVASDLVWEDDLAPRSDVATLDRVVINAIIENDKWEFLLEKDSNWHFVGWGIEGWDTAEETVHKEILEETWYKNIQIERKILDYSFMYAYRLPKNKNQKTNSIWYHIKLLNDEKIPSEADEGKHILEWVKKEDVEKKLERPHHIISWEVFNKWAYTWPWKLVNSWQFNDLDNIEAKRIITTELEKLWLGRKKITYRLRDWSVSRQRYRGSPIPVYYTFEDNEDGRYTADNPHPDKTKRIPHLIPESELPVVLPLDLPNYKPAGKSPLEDHPTFKYYYAPDGQVYLRECDTLDTFMCSSFYYLRFLDPTNSDYLISPDVCNRYMPVDLYIWGKEHTVWHLLYSRFIYKFLKDKWYIVNESKEPFHKLVHQGMVHAHDGRKMSKRWGNVIDPMDIIKVYGSDTLRTYIMFMWPIELNKNRNPDAVAWVKRFLDRVERAIDFVSDIDDKDIDSLTQQTIRWVTEDIDMLKFNTAISKIMILTNGIYDHKSVSRSNFESLLLLLSPFATKITQKLRADLNNDWEVSKQSWPMWDDNKITSSIINLPIQIGGKMRWTILVSPDILQEDALSIIKSDERFTKYITWDIKKVIWVPGKICNIII